MTEAQSQLGIIRKQTDKVKQTALEASHNPVSAHMFFKYLTCCFHTQHI